MVTLDGTGTGIFFGGFGPICKDIGLFDKNVGLSYRDIGLLDRNIGLSCGDIGVFCGDTGLVYREGEWNGRVYTPPNKVLFHRDEALVRRHRSLLYRIAEPVQSHTGLFCRNVRLFLQRYRTVLWRCSALVQTTLDTMSTQDEMAVMSSLLLHFRLMQQTATHCKTLQHTATHCNTLQNTATHCNTLQHTAAHGKTLHHTAPHCNTLQHTARHCSKLQHTTTHCNTLQHTTAEM